MGNYGNRLVIDSSVAGLPLGATSLVAHPMDADITTPSLELYRACSGSTYIKIGTIQRRLAWPLRKDDTQIREAFQILSFLVISFSDLLAACPSMKDQVVVWPWPFACRRRQRQRNKGLHHKGVVK